MTAMNRQELSLDALLKQAGWARRLARSLVSESDAADDLVQETWLSALRRPPTIAGSARPWLGAVLRNLGTNRAQATRRRDTREREFGAIEDTAASAEELLARMEAQKMLAGLVTALGEPYRQCVLLRYYEDLSSSEIAARLGIPPGTVRWRLKERSNTYVTRSMRRMRGTALGGWGSWRRLCQRRHPGPRGARFASPPW